MPFRGAQNKACLLRNHCILGGPQTRGPKQKWLPHPYLLGGAKRGQKSDVSLVFLGIPQQGDRLRGGCLTRAFLGNPKEGITL